VFVERIDPTALRHQGERRCAGRDALLWHASGACRMTRKPSYRASRFVDVEAGSQPVVLHGLQAVYRMRCHSRPRDCCTPASSRNIGRAVCEPLRCRFAAISP
jgi:hypothetical protein